LCEPRPRGQLGPSPVERDWYRAIRPRYLAAPLATLHTTLTPTRYNPARQTSRQFETLYLAEDHLLCLREVEAIYGFQSRLVPNPVGTWCILNVAIVLARVVDLTSQASLRLIGTSIQELTGQWRGYPNSDAPTQLLAAALFGVGDVEGVLVPSARQIDGRILVIFPARLGPESAVEYTDAANTIHRIP
jgi:RES domain-containing protein